MRTFGKIMKYSFFAILIILVIIIGIRIAMSANRGVLKDIYPTEKAIEAYEADGKEAFLTHKLSSDISPDGYFTAYAMTYAPSVGELQMTVRYNDSLPEKYLPGSDPESYYFKLCDSEGNTVAKSRVLSSKELYFYNHFRIVFEDIEMDEDTTLTLFLCDDESEYPADHTQGIIIHHPSMAFHRVSLSGDEKKALTASEEK